MALTRRGLPLVAVAVLLALLPVCLGETMTFEHDSWPEQWERTTENSIYLQVYHSNGYTWVENITVTVNTTGDAETYKYRWVKGIGVTEVSDPSGIGVLGSTTAANPDSYIKAVRQYITWAANSTTGWCTIVKESTSINGTTITETVEEAFYLSWASPTVRTDTSDIARISVECNNYQANQVDYYDHLVIHFMKSFEGGGTHWLNFTNASGDMYTYNITDHERLTWHRATMNPGDLAAGRWDIKIGVGSDVYHYVELLVRRPALVIDKGFQVLKYGFTQTIEPRLRNWRYWANHYYKRGWFRANVTEGGELKAEFVVKTTGSNFTLARKAFTFRSIASVVEQRDIGATVEIKIMNPGSLGNEVYWEFYALKKEEGERVFIDGGTTNLQSKALMGTALDTVSQTWGLEPEMVRTVVALAGCLLFMSWIGMYAKLTPVGWSIIFVLGILFCVLIGWLPWYLALIAAVITLFLMAFGPMGSGAVGPGV